jgi:hypothetical protein
MTERGLARKGLYFCRGCGTPLFTGWMPKYCRKCHLERENQQARERIRRKRSRDKEAAR